MQSERFILSKSQAIDAIANADKNTVIILDFDETLLLRNSTAEYLDNLRPRLIGFILITVLKLIGPWRWLPVPFKGDKTKDWFLVIMPTILLPWTLLLWQKRAKQLAENHGNLELMAAVKSNNHSPIVFASLGFEFIINPILQQLPLEYLVETDRRKYLVNLVSCRFWQGAKDRNKGKLMMIQEVLSNEAISSAIVVTDSKDDLPLLQIVKYPCLIVWSSAKYINPFQDFWLSSLISRLNK